MHYLWWLCNAGGERLVKLFFFPTFKVLKDYRHLKLPGFDFKPLSPTVDRQTKTQKRTPSDVGAV